LLALRKDRVDLHACTVQVVEQYQELASGELILGPPKTAAGHRTVSIPEAILGDLREHLRQHTAPGPRALLFGSEFALERPLSRKTFYRQWKSAVTVTAMEGFRFHDYADIRVMPTSWRNPCPGRVKRLKLSA
jgi:integrase